MNIVLPIVFAAAVLGLFVKRLTRVHWIVLACWIVLVTARYYMKN